MNQICIKEKIAKQAVPQSFKCVSQRSVSKNQNKFSPYSLQMHFFCLDFLSKIEYHVHISPILLLVYNALSILVKYSAIFFAGITQVFSQELIGPLRIFGYLSSASMSVDIKIMHNLQFSSILLSDINQYRMANNFTNIRDLRRSVLESVIDD